MRKSSLVLPALEAAIMGLIGSRQTHDLDSVLRDLAPHLLVLEHDCGEPVYRLAGAAVQRMLGADPQGHGYYDYWDDDAHGALQSFFHISAGNGRPFQIVAEALCLETVLVPLARDCFIGISVPSQRRGRHGGRTLQRLHAISFLHDPCPRPGHPLYPHPMLVWNRDRPPVPHVMPGENRA